MNSSESERLRASRFKAGLPASVRVAGRERPCRAHDLSRTGVMIVGRMPPPASPDVVVTLGSPKGDLSVTVEGRIARAELDPEAGQVSLAVEFGRMAEGDRRTLESLISRVVEGMAPGALESLPDSPSPQEVRRALEQIPLPHRIALAARALPREREFLIQDSHLQVIDALVRNPGLLFHEALKIVRMPNLLPHTLEVLARDQRWSGNAQLMAMVVTHRSTPLGVAEKIISRMSRTELERVIRASGLSPALRPKVLRLLKR
jgi:hypothetical protein